MRPLAASNSDLFDFFTVFLIAFLTRTCRALLLPHPFGHLSQDITQAHADQVLQTVTDKGA